MSSLTSEVNKTVEVKCMEQRDFLGSNREQEYLLKVIGIPLEEYNERLDVLTNINRLEIQRQVKDSVSLAIFSAVMFAIALLCRSVTFLDLPIWGFMAVIFLGMFAGFITNAIITWPKLKDGYVSHKAQDALDAMIGQRIRKRLRMIAEANLREAEK